MIRFAPGMCLFHLTDPKPNAGRNVMMDTVDDRHRREMMMEIKRHDTAPKWSVVFRDSDVRGQFCYEILYPQSIESFVWQCSFI